MRIAYFVQDRRTNLVPDLVVQELDGPDYVDETDTWLQEMIGALSDSEGDEFEVVTDSGKTYGQECNEQVAALVVQAFANPGTTYYWAPDQSSTRPFAAAFVVLG